MNILFYKSDIYENKDFQHVLFDFRITKQDNKKWYPVLCEEFENEKKKLQKKFDLPEWGFKPRIFSNFPTHNLNFHGRLG